MTLDSRDDAIIRVSHAQSHSLRKSRESRHDTPEEPSTVAIAAPVVVESRWTRFRDAFRLVPKDSTPLRWTVIGNVVVALFVCVVNITMLFPYLPQMVRDMGYEECEVG